MKLSEALRILGNFRNNGHIDPDLFEIFVQQRVYLRHSEQYLDVAQMDLRAGQVVA